MINLASLSALIRTLRQAGGPDGPAAPVARVPPVASLTPEDRPGSGGGTAAVQGWARSQARNAALLDDELLSRPALRRNVQVEERTAVAVAAARAQTGSARASSPASIAAGPESTELELTVGGKVLQSVLRASGGAAPMPPAILATVPLVRSSRALPAEIASGLHRSVAESGLFYESHLARWVRRDYPASALGREPQATWPAASAWPTAPDDGLPTLVSDSTTQLLTRQLDALDTRAVVWSGELWPGQRATVALEEDRNATHEDLEVSDDAASSAWRTRVVIDLPSLGRVEATLALRGETLDLLLETVRQDARQRLAEAHETLSAALAGGRVRLGNFAVAVAAE